MQERMQWGADAAEPHPRRAAVSPAGHRRWRLAEALLARGAHWIVASPGNARDTDLSALLTAVAVGIRVGRSAGEVIRGVRVAPPGHTWLNDIVVFE
jgi:hypothetical protein